MNKKQKGILGIVLILLIAPMAGTMLMSGHGVEPTILDNTPFSPEKTYAVAADCAVTTADSGVTNADDTDNLYGGGYRSYIVTANCSFGTRGSDIDNITISFYKGATEYFAFVYDNDTETATESVGTTYARIGTVSNVTSAEYANITIAFKVEWAMTDVDDVDLNITAWNGDNSTSAQKNADYDFDTDLTLASTDFMSTSYVAAGGAITFNSPVVSYEDSGGNNYPLANETDFLITRTPPTGSTDSWSESTYTDSTGVCTFAAITAGHIAQTETYTFTTYTQDGTTTNLFGSAKTDTVGVSNRGGGGDNNGGAVPIEWNSQTLLVLGVIGFGGYLFYSLFLSDSKSRSTGRKKSKRKSSKKKGRKR